MGPGGRNLILYFSKRQITCEMSAYTSTVQCTMYMYSRLAHYPHKNVL